MDTIDSGSETDAQRTLKLYQLLSAADSKFDDDNFGEACELYKEATTEEYYDLLGPEDLWKDVAFNATLSAVAAKDLETARYYFKWGEFEMSDFEEIESVYYLLAAEPDTAGEPDTSETQ